MAWYHLVTTRCPICKQDYQYMEGTEPFKTCGKLDCMKKYWLGDINGSKKIRGSISENRCQEKGL